MITIQSAMLVALGFLAATLLALLVAPAFWARAARLTSRRIRASMPVTEAEIRADKDRLRAEYAMQVHQLESKLDQAKMASARASIDLNQRDAVINDLQAQVDRMKAALEEAQNARRVLEQTVTDRLPRVEQRLSEARRLIFSRDREIAELARTADKQSRALSEAAAINAQQLAEIERLSATLAARGARSKGGRSDPRVDSEVALRSELEALRAKTRDQSQLISRMQSQMGRFTSFAPTPTSILRPLETTGEPLAAVNGESDKQPSAKTGASSRSGAAETEVVRAEHEAELRALRAQTQDQVGEIARLKAALAVFEGETEEQKLSVRDSRIALKARLGGLEAQIEQQKEVILRVRSELAAANERLARQAAHFTSELKRLGAGTVPASVQPRRQAAASQLTLADRVAQVRVSAAAEATEMAKPTPAPKPGAAAGPNGATVEGHKSDIGPQVAAARKSENEEQSQPETPPKADGPEDRSTQQSADRATPGQGGRKPRLLERIASLAKTD